MLKGLLSGVFWGAFASVVVVVGASLNAPLPGPRTGNVEPTLATQPSGAAPQTPLVVPATDAAPTVPDPTRITGLEPPQLPELTLPDPTEEAVPAPEAEAEPDAVVELAPTPEDPVPDEVAELVEDETPAPETPEPDPAPEAPTAPEGPEPEAELDLPDAETSEAEADPVVEPEVAPAPEPETTPEPEPETEPETETAEITLPVIDENAGTVEVPSLNPSLSLNGGALRRNALSVNIDTSLPVFSIVLIDRSASGLPLAEVAGFPAPLTIALDPTQPGAIDASNGYGATGHEVLVLANSLPENASPLEAAAALTGLLNDMPAAVGVLLPPGSPFVRDANRASELTAILAQSGHGLVSLPQGLDALGREAASAGVPDAEVFRVLDSEGEGIPLMTRYLDRAAFQAARDGSVVVLGIVQPDTMAALTDWIGGRRAETVAVAPVSTIMLQE